MSDRFLLERINPGDLDALASLLEAIVPGPIKDMPPGWSMGWQACCQAIRTVAEHGVKHAPDSDTAEVDQ